MRQLLAFIKDDSGATAIEYGLIAALISVIAITAISQVGTRIQQTFLDIGGNLSSS